MDLEWLNCGSLHPIISLTSKLVLLCPAFRYLSPFENSIYGPKKKSTQHPTPQTRQSLLPSLSLSLLSLFSLSLSLSLSLISLPPLSPAFSLLSLPPLSLCENVPHAVIMIHKPNTNRFTYKFCCTNLHSIHLE